MPLFLSDGDIGINLQGQLSSLVRVLENEPLASSCFLELDTEDGGDTLKIFGFKLEQGYILWIE